MADIVRKIGKITRYETKAYIETAKILDLDRSSDTPRPPFEEEPQPGNEEWLPKA